MSTVTVTVSDSFGSLSSSLTISSRSTSSSTHRSSLVPTAAAAAGVGTAAGLPRRRCASLLSSTSPRENSFSAPYCPNVRALRIVDPPFCAQTLSVSGLESKDCAKPSVEALTKSKPAAKGLRANPSTPSPTPRTKPSTPSCWKPSIGLSTTPVTASTNPAPKIAPPCFRPSFAPVTCSRLLTIAPSPPPTPAAAAAPVAVAVGSLSA